MTQEPFLNEEYPDADAFRGLLSRFPEDVIAKRYLLTGVPFIFREHPLQYISFAETVARNLDIGSHDVAVIGSARIGYSLSPSEYGRSVQPGSDVDTVVVSSKLFSEGVEQIVDWLADFQVDQKGGFVTVPEAYWQPLQMYSQSIRNGFISPNFLPNHNTYKAKVFSALNEVATQLLAMKPPGPIWKVRCRIFDTWKSAEEHYANSLRRLKRDLALAPVAAEE